MTPDLDPPPSDSSPPLLHEVVEAYRRHERSVHRLCMRQLRSVEAADDATQETFLRVSVRMHAMRPEELSSYLHGIARNVCREELRRRQRAAPGGASSADASRVADPEDLVIERSFIDEVWRTLSSRDRALFILRLAGYSYEEVAQRLRISVKAVDVGLTRARHRARRLLEKLPAVAAFARRAWSRREHRRRAGRRSAARHRPAGRWATWKLALAVAAAVPLLHSGAALGTLAGVLSPAQTLPASASVPVAAGAPWSDPLLGTEVSDLTVSPDYGRDRTIYASARRGDCRSKCSILARSGDGGHTWTALPARGFTGGPVLLAPTHPTDPIILVAGPDGLQRSDDGGGSFRTVVPAGGPVAVAPGSQPGDSVAAVASQRIIVYHTGSGATTAGPALPAGAHATAVSFTADGRHLLVAVIDVGGTDQEQGRVLRCDLSGGTCRTLLVEDHASVFRLLALPQVAGGGIAIASSTRLYQASPDGTAVHLMHAFAPDEVTELAAVRDGAGAVRLVAGVRHGAMGPSRLTESTDGGRSFGSMGVAMIPAGSAALALLPDGGILIAVSGADAMRDGGVRCSRDGGRTWLLRC